MRRDALAALPAPVLLGGEALAIERADWLAPFDPEQELQRSLTSHRLLPAAEAIWSRSPPLHRALLRLMGHTTPHFPGERQPLMLELPAEAVLRYGAAAEQGLSGEQAFLETLAQAVDRLMDWQLLACLRADAGTPCWNPCAEALPPWLARQRVDRLFLRRTPGWLDHERLGARLALLARLLDPRELGLLAASGALTLADHHTQ